MGAWELVSWSIELFFGVMVPNGRVIILVLQNELVSNDVDKWNTCLAPDTGQDGLYLLECLGSQG